MAILLKKRPRPWDAWSGLSAIGAIYCPKMSRTREYKAGARARPCSLLARRFRCILPITPKTSASTFAMNVADARIVALGVKCATIGLLGWIPNLTHSLFNDAKNGMQKEVFCKTRRFGFVRPQGRLRLPHAPLINRGLRRALRKPFINPYLLS
jgi:hypothetical protein